MQNREPENDVDPRLSSGGGGGGGGSGGGMGGAGGAVGAVGTVGNRPRIPANIMALAYGQPPQPAPQNIMSAAYGAPRADPVPPRAPIDERILRAAYGTYGAPAPAPQIAHAVPIGGEDVYMQEGQPMSLSEEPDSVQTAHARVATVADDVRNATVALPVTELPRAISQDISQIAQLQPSGALRRMQEPNGRVYYVDAYGTRYYEAEGTQRFGGRKRRAQGKRKKSATTKSSRTKKRKTRRRNKKITH